MKKIEIINRKKIELKRIFFVKISLIRLELIIMIDELMEEAFRLFEEAEMKVGSDTQESIILFRRAVSNLFNVYLAINGVEGAGSLAELFLECVKIDSEFETIRPEVEFLTTVIPKEADTEELVDQANEIWDFIEGIMGEEEMETD